MCICECTVCSHCVTIATGPSHYSSVFLSPPPHTLLPIETSPAASSTQGPTTTPHTSRLNSIDHLKIVFSLSFQVQVPRFLDGPTTVKTILSLPVLLASPQHTPPLPFVVILSKLQNQPKIESIFVPCVTKYLCIIKDFSCVCAINY